MRAATTLLLIVSLVAVACESDASAPPQKIDGATLAKACGFSMWVLDENLKPAAAPFIKPEHVLSIDPARPQFEGDHAMLVTLTAEGARRMREQTTRRVGSQVAAYCGKTRYSIIYIMGPVTGPFRVSMPGPHGT
jgi:hypothetical protein